MNENRQGTTDAVRETILARIRRRQWPPGAELPSERELMEEFKVGRIPLREALAGLRALGVLQTRAGSGTRVRRVDADSVAQLLPLLVTLEGERTFGQVFELRLAVESQTAALAPPGGDPPSGRAFDPPPPAEPQPAAPAPRRHTDADARALKGFLVTLKEDLDANLDEAVEADLDFHVAIARATGNPLFEVLM